MKKQGNVYVCNKNYIIGMNFNQSNNKADLFNATNYSGYNFWQVIFYFETIMIFLCFKWR